MELPITKAERNLKRVGGFLGVIQGSACFLLALICIIMYNEGVKSLMKNSDEVYKGNSFMYTLFIGGVDDNIPGQITTPRVFTSFMWAYLILDFFWIMASFNVINKNKRNVRLSLKLWNVITFLISILDAAFVILLGLDYIHCLDDWFIYLSMDQIELEAFCANGILPVLIIVGKGFILWIVNVVFIVLFWKIARRLKDNSTVQIVRPYGHMHHHPSIDLAPPFPVKHNGNEVPRMNGHVRTSYEYQSVVFAPFRQ